MFSGLRVGACDTNKINAAYRSSTTRPLYLALKSASRINNAVSLNSQGVYVNTIKLIYRAVQNGWGNPSSLALGHAYGGDGVDMVIVSTAPAMIDYRI